MKRLWPEEDDFTMICIFLAVFFTFFISLMLSWE